MLLPNANDAGVAMAQAESGRAYWTLVLVSAPDPRERGLATNASKADIHLGA